MNCFFFLLLPFHTAFAVKHQLNYFHTASSGIPDLPEFMTFSTFDGVQCGYCDSSGRVEPGKEWAKKFFKDYLQRYERCVNKCEDCRHRYRAQIVNLKQQLNQSEGVHILQNIEGCELDDETGEVGGFSQFGYDGENVISFDLETATWVAAKPQALITKHKWDEDLILNKELKDFYIHVCPDRIKRYMEYVKRLRKRAARPSVSLLQRTPSSPVSCHATGFSPDSAVMSWRKDGQEIHEDVQHWEILPNPDGSFQMSVELEISSVKAEDWRRYQCVFNLSGVKEEIVTRLDRASIRTNWVSPSEFPSDAVAVGGAGLVLLALFVTGLLILMANKVPVQDSDQQPAQTAPPLSSLQMQPVNDPNGCHTVSHSATLSANIDITYTV